MMFDIENFLHFHFLRPWWLLTIVSAFFFARWFFGPLRVGTPWTKAIAPHLLAHLFVAGETKKKANPAHVFLIGAILAALAMAGPSWKRSASPFSENQASLAVVLDLSRSMDQTDIAPSRLERAKQKIHDLVQLRPGARTGLIVFSGSSHLVVPLTHDPGVIENFLFALRTDIMPSQGKTLSPVIPLIGKMFKTIDFPATVLVIADGASPSGIDAFSRYCAASGHQLIVYGMGRILPDESGEKADAGRAFAEAFIPLAKDELRSLAKRCNGMYLEATPDKADVEKISRRIDFHFMSGEDTTRPWIDAGYFLLFPIAALFLLWFRRGWRLTWGMAAIVLAVSGNICPAYAADHAFLNLWLTPDQQGRWYFEKGDYKTAADRFEDPLWKGVSFYMNENFEAAAELFARIETPEGFFNLGNALAHGQHYVRAVETYDRLLALAPDHREGEKNRRVIRDIIDEINRVSQSQAPEPGESSRESGNDPVRARGAEKTIVGNADSQQYGAEQILSDSALYEMWMRQVQQDLAGFLSIKFQMQFYREQHENAD